ncbi:MAG: Na+/H+ antiporter NhaC family protein [Bacteroidales bacterium]|nr:Na+/H+ antiporter NhaC family protein [Bacteroidales bacterium]
MSSVLERHGKGLLALSPVVVFLAVYLVSSLVSGDFYKIPVSAAFLLASCYAVAITPERGLDRRLALFSEGAGHPNVLLMIWIFILAGAFAATAKEIGAIDATVHFALHVIPGKMLFAGFFLTACFISFAMGTSVGTIVALVPITTGIAQETGIGLAQLTAVVVGGAFFGDNLSFISDTTLASTQAAGCAMRDKFKANLLIVLPAFAVVMLIYLVQGRAVSALPETSVSEWYKLLPYLLVVCTALLGLNVTLVLGLGILANALLGCSTGALDWTGLLVAAGTGIAGMADLIIVTLLAGGMLALIRHNGGVDYLVGILTRRIKGPRGAQLSIAALVSLANLCTANNTIAIITSGEISKRISDRFGIPARRTASLLDTFSCVVQGLIPYGAQLLMASGLAGVSALDIIPRLYYPLALCASALLAILILPAKGLSK